MINQSVWGVHVGDISLEELTHDNVDEVKLIDRDDICEEFVDTVDTIMDITDYGISHGCIGHTFAIKYDNKYIGVILLGEALEWETDPPEMREEPFYRLMGFCLDRNYRGKGLGSKVLEMTIQAVYAEFGKRPIALECHERNSAAAKFYLMHGFKKTAYKEGHDEYYLRYCDI